MYMSKLHVHGKYHNGDLYSDIVENDLYFEEIEGFIISTMEDIKETEVEFLKMGSPNACKDSVVKHDSLHFTTEIEV